MTKKKMKQTFLNQERGNRERLAFSRHLHYRYGMHIQTAYGKFRRGMVKKWELVGIEDCVRQFDAGYTGELKDFYAQTTRKKFCRFMEERFGMSEGTVIRRFLRRFDFEEWELKGLNRILEEFRKEQAEAESSGSGENKEKETENRE